MDRSGANGYLRYGTEDQDALQALKNNIPTESNWKNSFNTCFINSGLLSKILQQ